MQRLATPTKTAEIVARHDFIFRKKFGQNFLTDSSMVEKIVEAAELTKEDTVLEIGPGIGTMTQLLAEQAGKVLTVEIDKALLPVLAETLADYDNVRVINADILKTDIPELLREEKVSGRIKVVANLPYYITTPIMMKLLEEEIPLASMTLMVQSEVAERIQSGPGSKDYGALSLAIQYRAVSEIVCTVPPECFMPRPKVSSTVIRLNIHEELPVKAKDAGWMFRIIRASFQQRRKTLANSLANAGGLGLSREQVTQALEEMGLAPMIRGEALSLAQFAAFSDKVLRGTANSSEDDEG